MFCREQVARLADRLHEIRDLGAELHAIGNGTPEFARAFLEEVDAEFPLYTDPERDAYRHFGMRRSFADLLRPRTLAHAARAFRAGHRQTRTRGDAFQNGGVVVVGRGGNVLFEHVERESGDLADLDEVIRALERHASPLSP